MANIIRRPDWWLPDSRATNEAHFWSRRRFLKSMGGASIGALGLTGAGGVGCAADAENGSAIAPLPPPPDVPEDVLARFPAKRNPAFTAGRPVTPEPVSGRYNNFYEFTTDKARVWRLAKRLRSRPWSIEISGLVNKPQTIDVDDLIRRMPMEERVYRFRCVEAWAMTVPWTGFPFRELLAMVEPTAKAKYVRLVTFFRPKEAAGQRAQTWYPWPYFEALRLDEAMNDLAMLVTGAYGKPLPNQHGAPLRLITPWKYGFKSIKSIVQMEFTDEQPPTFWNSLNPAEYDFWANVNPQVPHPRWSQASERLIDTNERVPTLMYNGYSAQVASLYT